LLGFALPNIALALFICFLFHISSKNKIDRTIGELSYPLYICHGFIINFAGLFLPSNNYFPYITLMISLTVSTALVRWIQKPIDDYRLSRLKQAHNKKKIRMGGLPEFIHSP